MGKKRSREAANKVHDEDRMDDSDSGEVSLSLIYIPYGR